MAGRRDHGFDDAATVTRSAPERPMAHEGRFRVEVAIGPDRGKQIVVDATRPARVLVGKGAACELALTDREVSRRHASLDVDAGLLRLVDLGSTNGTFVNGVRIHDVSLAGGERIDLGSTTLHVHLIDKAATTPLSAATRFGKLVGESEEMRRLYPLCDRLAATEVPVVIEGETGTGKEVLAECIHEASARAGGPFVVFDCTTVAPTLLEAALFGHERGAFTGANETRVGVFEEAHGGTLLVDEIGDLDVALQAKLLRVLERSEVRRVGGKGWIKVDVRVLAATRRDLDVEVQEGRFRDDLFFRLAVTRIELPPLRRRHGDVTVLARHFWKRLGGAGDGPPPDVLARFEAYAWPGNVRELHHAVARHLALGDLAAVTPSRRAPASPAGGASDDPFEEVLSLELPLPVARQQLVDAFERRYVERVLAKHGGNVVRAAEASGIARRYFQLIRARQRGGR